MIQKNQTPLADIFYNKTWGSNSPDHRKKLRQYVSEKFNDAHLLELQLPPQNPLLSISHCPSLGAFCVGKRKTIGLDLEEVDRLRSPLIQRISNEAERSLTADQSFYLWPLKEAGFKCFFPQVKTMTEVCVSSFQVSSFQKESAFFSGEVHSSELKGTFICGPLNSDVVFAIVQSL